AVAEVLAQPVSAAAGHADAVDVNDVAGGVRGDLRRDDPRAREALVVHAGERAAPVVPALEPPQLDPENRGLDLVEPRVVADHRVVVARRLAVLAERAELVGEAVVIRRDAPRLSIRPEVLAAIEGAAADAA